MWKEDPGQVIYQTMQPGTSNTSTPQTTTQWSMNTLDQEIGIGAHNTASIIIIINSNFLP